MHEIESLFAIPEIVEAVCTHLSRTFESAAYQAALRDAIPEQLSRATIINRWKASVEPRLGALLSDSEKKKSSIEDLASALPKIFDKSTWSFDPQEILEEQRLLVERALAGEDTHAILRIFPGKPLLATAAHTCGLEKSAYVDLVTKTVASKDSSALQVALVAALTTRLPPRAVPAQVIG